MNLRFVMSRLFRFGLLSWCCCWCWFGVMSLGGCDPSTEPSVPGQPRRLRRDPTVGIELKRHTITFSGPAVAKYGGRSSQRWTSVERAIATAMADMPMEHNPALSRWAREMAHVIPGQTDIPAQLVEVVLAWSGLVDPPPGLISVELGEAADGCASAMSQACAPAIASLLDLVALSYANLPRGRNITFGVGVARGATGRVRMLVAVSERTIELAPVPTSVALGRAVKVSGRLVGPRTRPTIEVVAPSGTAAQIPTTLSVDGSFGAQIRCGKVKGPYQIEVMAQGEHGPEVVANFPLYCGMRMPTRVVVESERLQPGVGAEQIALANFMYLNAERKRRGLAELEWDGKVARIATAHSRDMAQNNFVGHRSPRTGSVDSRFERAKVRGSIVRENVARGYGPKAIHTSLMSSPGHRVNLLATDVTHVGIGVVIGPADSDAPGVQRPILCTQNFYKKPGAGAPSKRALVPTLRKQVDAQRGAAGRQAVGWDPALERIAARLAQTMARGRALPKGWEQEVFELGYASVELSQVRAQDFDQLSTARLWDKAELAVGVGISRAKGEAAAFLMIVVVAQR